MHLSAIICAFVSVGLVTLEAPKSAVFVGLISLLIFVEPFTH